MRRTRTSLLLVLVLTLLSFSFMFARTITVINNSGQTVCPGMQGSTVPNGGGWCQNAGTSVAISVPDNWTAARVWGRTGCNTATGHCDTGDCGNKIACAGAGGIPPASLSEWTLQGAGGLDYYDVSLVDGYNLPMTLQSVGGTKSGNGTKYDCGSPACTSDLNASCPSALQVVLNGKVIACKSACEAFNTDQYCCRGAYGTPATCPPTSYSQAFKAACPDAYSYAYDDHASTYTCIGGNYNVIFGATSSSSSSSSSSSTSSGAATSIVSGGLYEIVNVNSGKAIDVAYASAADGAIVQQCTRYNNAAQTWKISDTGAGLSLIAQCSGKALDCTAWGTGNGTKLEQWSYHGGACQRFGAAYYSNGWKFWTVQSGARCIDVPGSSVNDGVQLQLWDDNGTTAQRWTLYKK